MDKNHKCNTRNTRPLSLLLAMAILLTLASALATPASAAEPAAGTTWTINNTTPSTVWISYGGGLFYWDKNIKILTLNNVTHTTSARIALRVPAGTHISLYGRNTIASSYNGESSSFGIYHDDDNGFSELTISSSDGGSLTATAGTSTKGDSYGISGGGGGVYITGVQTNITATGGAALTASMGIEARKDIKISNSPLVTAISGAADTSDGICSSGSVIISDYAVVTATGGTAKLGNSHGIHAYQGITINTAHKDAKVTATGGTANAGSTFGIFAAGILTITNSAWVTAKGGMTEFGSYGMSADKKITINQNSTVTATGGPSSENRSIAIYARETIAINDDADVTATGGTAKTSSDGIYAAAGITIDGNAKVNATVTESAALTSYGIRSYNGTLSISDSAEVTARGNLDRSGYGISTKGLEIVGGGVCTATGSTRAISSDSGTGDYTVPDGYTYYVNTTTTPSSTRLTGDGSTTKIDQTHKYAKIIAEKLITITSASVTVVEPVGGAKPSTEVRVPSRAMYSATISWGSWSGENRPSGSVIDTFKEGSKYICYITLTAKEGYSIGHSTNVTVNKKTAEFGRSSGSYYVIFTATAQFNSATPDEPDEPDNPDNSDDATPVIATLSLPDGTVGKAYNQAMTAYGKTPIEWTIPKGKLPDGLTLSTSGVILGTPSFAGNFDFVIEATNSAGSDSKTLTIVIDADSSTDDNWENPFDDLYDTEWYYKDVKIACQLGLINGVTPTHFAPKDNLTYAQAIKLAACMHQKHATGKITLANGTAPANWYDTYVNYAISNGIISPEHNYVWTAKATRAGYIEIFARALPDEALPAANTIPDGSIKDVPMSHPNSAAIYKLYRAGIVEGTGAAHNCDPEANIQRCQVAAILVRMMLPTQRKTFSMGG